VSAINRWQRLPLFGFSQTKAIDLCDYFGLRSVDRPDFGRPLYIIAVARFAPGLDSPGWDVRYLTAAERHFSQTRYFCRTL